MSFNDFRILVLGGASGIGAAAARLLAAQGGHVLVHTRRRVEEAQSLCHELVEQGGRAEVLVADLTDPDHVAGLLAAAGTVHGLVHSVSPPLQQLAAVALDWEHFQTHFDGAVKSLHLVLSGLLKVEAPALRSVVAVVSSAVLGMPPRKSAAYVTAKYALEGYCRALAVELAPQVRVNCVSPGFTPTPLTSYVDPRHHDIMARSVPMGRLCTAEDVAQAIAFLLQDGAGFVTGINLPVTGGTAI